MIQRIQTVFLIVVVVALITFNFFPYWTGTNPADGSGHALYSYAHIMYGVEAGTSVQGLFIGVAIITGIAVLIAVLEIFAYKNRLTQMKLGVLNSVLMTLTLLLMTYFVLGMQQNYTGTFGIGLFVFAMAMLFNILARRFIQKDERLVRSVDRLR